MALLALANAVNMASIINGHRQLARKLSDKDNYSWAAHVARAHQLDRALRVYTAPNGAVARTETRASTGDIGPQAFDTHEGTSLQSFFAKNGER